MKNPENMHENDIVDTEPNDDFISGAEQESEIIQRKLEKIWAQVKPGWTIAVHRIRPAYCKGYLERIEIVDDEPLDMGYLIDTWGGQHLRLRICDATGTYRGNMEVPLYSYPPKRYGTILTRADWEKEVQGSAPMPVQQIAPYIQLPQAQQQDPFASISQLMAFAKNLQGDQIKLFSKLLERTPTEPAIVGNTLKGTLDALKEFREMADILIPAEQKIQSDDTALFSTLGEIVKALVSNKNTPQVRQGPRVVAHSQLPRGPAAPIPNPAGGQPAQPGQPRDVAAYLSTLSPEQQSEQFLRTLAMQGMEKRQEIIHGILSGLGLDEELESGGEEDDFDDATDPDSDDDFTPDA